MNKDLKPRQIAFLFIAFLPVTKLLSMLKTAATYSNEDMWISILINMLLDLLTICVLLYVSKKSDLTFFEILEQNTNTCIGKTVLFLYFLFFIIKAYPLIIENGIFVKSSLYESSPNAFSLFPFFILAVYFSSCKLRAIGRISDIFFSVTVVGLLIIIALSIESADYFSILPIGANGKNILLSSTKIAPWFNDSAYFLFLLGYFSKEKRQNAKIISGFIVYMVLTLIFAITFYAVFESISNTELFPLSNIAKFSDVISSVGRFDYAGIFLIMLPLSVSTALPLFFATRILKKIFNIEKTYVAAIITVLTVFIPITFMQSFSNVITDFIHDKLWIWLTLIANGIPLALPLLLRKRRINYEKSNAVSSV